MRIRAIEGYEGLYSVTDTGKVFSHISGKFLKLGQSSNGYLYVSLYKKGKMKKHKVHRLVAITYMANPDNKEQVNHINAIKTDNRVENLEWATRLENNQHKAANSLQGKRKTAHSKYKYVYIQKFTNKSDCFKTQIKAKVNGNVKRFVKTKTFSIEKYGYKEAELLAAKAANDLIDSFKEFSHLPKNEV